MHTKTHTVDSVVAMLRQQARPAELAGMARFGMATEGRLGLGIPALRALGKQLGRDHALALQLWDTGIPDAQILAALIAEPACFTSAEMDGWTKTMRSWDVCDQACNNAFGASPLAWKKVGQWAGRRDEFVRRSAFSLRATLATHDRQAPDQRFVDALALIEAAADDERNFVKKAVNWALRGIGKRNAALNAAAIDCARRLQQRGTRSARWIAADALRELQSDAVKARLSRI